MRFQVPQFIEVEDKIFGPLTIKQFIYLTGGAGLSIVFYLLIPTILISILFIIPIMVFSGMLAFYKINNKPFVFVLESGFKYFLNPKLYIWRHEQTPEARQHDIDPFGGSSAFIPKLSDSKLKDLTWTLDTKEALNPITRETKK